MNINITTLKEWLSTFLSKGEAKGEKGEGEKAS